jgi:DNA-binding NarL/FixJ family response regulator
MATMNAIRVLLADDHALVRAGIRSLLHNIAGVVVVAEASDGREALRLIGEHQPDIVLIDLAMPEMNGLEVVARAVAEYPHVGILVLSMHAGEEYVLRALRAGAAGYLLKGARASELELAVRAVARGETYLSSVASKHLIEQYVHSPEYFADIASFLHPLDRLTPRQREVLQLVAEGNTTKEIANKLYISTKTVEMHRSQLMERLGIYDVPGLVRYAIRNGVITADE